jgi:hypothetical protein
MSANPTCSGPCARGAVGPPPKISFACGFTAMIRQPCRRISSGTPCASLPSCLLAPTTVIVSYVRRIRSVISSMSATACTVARPTSLKELELVLAVHGDHVAEREVGGADHVGAIRAGLDQL